MLAILAVFLPLMGAIAAGFFPKKLGEWRVQLVPTACVMAAAVCSVLVFLGVALGHQNYTVTLFRWIESGDFTLDWAIKIDALSATMLCVVNIVSACVHAYSIGYMAEDPHKPRFFAYLSLFTFMMLMLVTANNFIQMFFGWEGVGLASYLLIGFWFHKDSANAASIKAFLVNRVGDFGFALGIAGVFMLFGSVEFETVFANAHAMSGAQFHFLFFDGHALSIVCFLLFIGAMGKSAQLGLHTWLPDAMEGPTPVSALIHAATMVTAGVFMLARCSPIFEFAPNTLEFVALIGAATAFIAGTIGMTQFDIKRVIAYSTMSQLGYMFFAIGVGAYGAAIFHLVTHAFFKALLFLGAGSVIHAMHHEQDMRKMGNLARAIPVTNSMMWIGSLALAGVGIPLVNLGLAGFYSKDIILESAFAAHSWVGYLAWILGVASAFVTAFYSWRLLIMVFGKKAEDGHTHHHPHDHAHDDVHDHDHHHEPHESPKIMLVPLYVLAAGAVFSGLLFYHWFVGEGRDAFWNGAIFTLNDVVHKAHHVNIIVKLIPLVAAVSGIWFAYQAYVNKPSIPREAIEQHPDAYRIFSHKYYFDEIYDARIVQPLKRLAVILWKVGDEKMIDGFGPNLIAKLTQMVAKQSARLQTGYVYHYAFSMLIGVVLLVSWYLFTR